MTDFCAEKKRIRRQVRLAIAALRPQERLREEARLCGLLQEFLLARPETLTGKVLAYLPLPDEPQLRPVLEFLQSRGCLCLPEMTAAGGLLLRAITDLQTELVAGPYGVQEPAKTCPLVKTEDLSAVIVPGRAFTATGDRLGRGKGYYDRLLAQLSEEQICTVAVAFRCQIFGSLPIEPHDRRIQSVLG